MIREHMYRLAQANSEEVTGLRGPRSSVIARGLGAGAGKKGEGRADPSGRAEPGPRPWRCGQAELVGPSTPAPLHLGQSWDLGAGTARLGPWRFPRHERRRRRFVGQAAVQTAYSR